jgi:hypothetical protein
MNFIEDDYFHEHIVSNLLGTLHFWETPKTKWVKAQCLVPKWMSQTFFFQKMKFTRRLHDNYIGYFMVWTQICMVVYICNEMHKKKLQLELVA